MNCQQCGRDNSGAARFCAGCGHALVATPATSDRPTAPTAAPAAIPTVVTPAVHTIGAPHRTNRPRRRVDAKTVGLGIVVAITAIGVAFVVAALVRPTASKARNAVDIRAQRSRATHVATPTTSAPRPVSTTTMPPPPSTLSPSTTVPATSFGNEGLIAPTGVKASSTEPHQADLCRAPSYYAPDRAFDADTSSAWESEGNQTSGDDDPSLTLYFAKPVEVTSISIVAGYLKHDPCVPYIDRWYQLRHITQIEYDFDGGRSIVVNTDPTYEGSTVTAIPNYVTGSVRVRIVGWDPPGGSEGGPGDDTHGDWPSDSSFQRVAISDIQIDGSS
jgi:hypothetical protein